MEDKVVCEKEVKIHTKISSSAPNSKFEFLSSHSSLPFSSFSSLLSLRFPDFDWQFKLLPN